MTNKEMADRLRRLADSLEAADIELDPRLLISVRQCDTRKARAARRLIDGDPVLGSYGSTEWLQIMESRDLQLTAFLKPGALGRQVETVVTKTVPDMSLLD